MIGDSGPGSLATLGEDIGEDVEGDDGERGGERPTDKCRGPFEGGFDGVSRRIRMKEWENVSRDDETDFIFGEIS